jgi:8-oxo-dGTP diphosphatase
MSEQLSAEVIEGAGGIVELHDSGQTRIAVVYRERYAGEWGLPKGKRQPGESWQATALREVEEEIGLNPIITGIVGATAYLAGGTPKLVLYWRMRVDGTVPPFEPNDEVKMLAWLSPEEAIKRLTHREEGDIVRRAFSMTGFTVRSCDRLDKWTVPIFRRRAMKRLRAEIDVYQEELNCRGGAKGPGLLDQARQAADNGDIDRGWRFLQAARRVNLPATGSPELVAAAVSIREEAAKKLGSWRKEAVETLLPKGTSSLTLGDVYEAAWLRDEHSNNQAYKDGLGRSSAMRLAVLLFMALLSLFWSARGGYLEAAIKPLTPDVFNFKALVGVAVVGFLGAVVSAITDVAKPGAPTRIPELVSTLRITILRLLMGPASAIFLYFVTQTELAQHIFASAVTKGGYIILVISFVAGFSERLVLRVVESFGEKSSG